MVIMATKFTPEVLLSAPRRSSAVPNESGTLALYSVSTYSFESHSRSAAINVLDIKTGNSTALYTDQAYSEPTWVSDSEFLLLKSGEKGNSHLLVADATKPGSEWVAFCFFGIPYSVSHSIPLPREIKVFSGSISGLKTTKLDDDTVALVVSAPTTPKGELYNPAAEPKSYSTGKVYTELFVRHWDSYVTKNKSSLWYGALKKGSRDIWSFVGSGLTNALQNTKLESPVPPFGGTGDFDISKQGLVFVASDPELNPALWTKTDLYYIALSTFTEEKPPVPQQVKTGHLQGYSGSPVFSHSGNSVAFKRMRHRQYESDKPRLLLIPDIKDLSNVQEFFKTDDGEGGWDQRPDAIVWSHDDKDLFVTAEDKGKSLLYRLPSTPLEAKELPKPVAHNGSIGDVFNLSPSSNKLLTTSTSLVDSSAYSVVDADADTDSSSPSPASVTLISSASKSGKSFGLHQSQVTSIWFPGAGDYKVHALVMKPSNFDSSKKYPLAFLIHGGPQGAWNESWSTRWNPAIFAEQGYVVVAPNPTGSTGYGQAFTDAIATQWGGRPYQDLEKGFEYVKSNLSYVDTDRAVALGASYGGYMVNWIQGQPLGRKFKALVCHDGVFSTMSDWSTEELFFTIHDMGGTLWDNREGYEKWDPAAYTGNWATPQLIIHSELDYRLPVTEGLAAFNVLQTRGVDSKLLIFPDENHWVLKPENSLVWHKEVLGWINKYAGLDTTGLAGDTEKLDI
ncbi:putative Dipeptidyl-peptidase V [Seiridium unicorne]|uniref:Dipeptidyl-peptidase V n=1 Tax=Seiridium unicorne TaxID=138068 RepID=A0ABR2V2F1_9PEZI